jgi:hypothetical protein
MMAMPLDRYRHCLSFLCIFVMEIATDPLNLMRDESRIARILSRLNLGVERHFLGDETKIPFPSGRIRDLIE